MSNTADEQARPIGVLSAKLGHPLVLDVYRSASGFYLGTWDHEGPYTRESVEYWPSREAAEQALTHHRWTQRLNL